MRTQRHIRRSLYILFMLAILSAGAGVAASDAGLAAVPVPPWRVNCNLNPPYYENNEVNVFHSTGATSYPVYRASSSGGTYSFVGNATAEYEYVNQYYDYAVTTFQTYYYKAKACNASGCSTLSTSYCACQLNTYPAPSNVQASDGTSASYVRVTYNTLAGPSKYGVYRASSPSGTYSFVAYDWDGSYDDTGTTAGVLLYYKVKSCTGTGQWGALASDTSGWRQLSPPDNEQASNGNYTGYVP
ncbi:MAG: hypothetical protein V1772_04810, partial [Chloroflexota bacterium]